MGKDRQVWILPQGRPALQVPVRSSDLLYLRAPHVPIGYAFAELLPEQALQDGLQATIDRFPIMAGRLQKFNEGKPYRIVLEKSQGCPLTFRTRRWAPPESKETPKASSWNKFFAAPVKDELFETDSSVPPFVAHVTWLPAHEHTILTVSFVHVFMDGSAISHFLNTWSHFAGIAAGVSPLPAQAPPLPDLNRECSFDQNILDEVHDNMGKEQDGPMSVLQVVKFLRAWAVLRFRAVRGDFVLDMDKVKNLKDEVSETLPPNTWVSTYEVMMAILLKLLHEADFGAEAEKYPINTRILVNARGRGNLDSQYYVGNSLAYVAIHIEPEDHSARGPGPNAWLAKTALRIHSELRPKMKDKNLLDRLHYVYEDGVNNRGAMRNVVTRLAWIKPWLINSFTTDSVCNSWLGYNWFEANFGGHTTPYLMYVPKSFSQRRMNFISPRTETEVLVRMHLHKSKLRRFARAVNRYDLPLVRLDEFDPSDLDSNASNADSKHMSWMSLDYFAPPASKASTGLVASQPEQD